LKFAAGALLENCICLFPQLFKSVSLPMILFQQCSSLC